MNERKKKIWFYPIYTKNEYTNIMQTCIRDAGYEVCRSNSIIELLKADIVHLNWFENLSKNRLKRLLMFLYKMMQLMIILFFQKPVICAFHNKTNHDKLHDNFESIIRKITLKYASKIILHSKHSLNDLPSETFKRKVFYIPHPNYCNVYKDCLTYKAYKKTKNDFIVLSFGAVRPYKKTELIIKLANEHLEYNNIKFIICGNCPEKKYENYLRKKIHAKNIVFDIRYIENDEIESLLSQTDVCILPYSTTSALNSGAAILAFSFGVTVLSTRTATIKDLEKTNLVYAYDYSENDEEHYRRLKKMFTKMYDDYCFDNTILKRKGVELRKIMQEKASCDTVANDLSELYLQTLT